MSGARRGHQRRRCAWACWLTLVLLWPSAAGAQPAGEAAAVTRLIELGREGNRVMEHLDALVNGIGPRLTGSRRLQRAEEWAVERFRSFGLDAWLEPWGEVPVGFDRGVSRGAAFVGADPAPQPLTFLTHAWTPGTAGPHRAQLVLAPAEAAMLDLQAETLRGRYLLLAGPSASGPMRQLFEARSAELGLAGLLQAGPANGLLQMDGRLPASLDELPKLPRFILLRSHFDELLARLRRGEHVDVEFDVENRATAGPIVQHNVIAELRGSELPDEYVIVGGHLDSWDGATGTTDNGTGVATTLEAARLLAQSGARPRRTIRFMLWGGEEQGLLGSRAWVARHADELPRISAVLVHDGGTNFVSGLGMAAAMLPQAEAALAAVREFVTGAAAATSTGGEPFSFRVREVPSLEPGGSSDHASFVASGVPAFFWDQAGEADYARTHHTQLDTFDAARADYQAHSSVVIALAALGLADLPERLSRERMVVPRRMLGVYLAADGCTVRDVAGGMQASQRGIERGDVLTAVNGEPIPAGSLPALLAAGEPRKLITWRRGDLLRSAVFTWAPPAWASAAAEREPEQVTLATGDGIEHQADYLMGVPGDGADRHPEGARPVAGQHSGVEEAALILLARDGGDLEAWAALRERLRAAGIATLAIAGRSDGGSTNAGATAGVAWLERRGYSGTRIGLMGEGAGGWVALRVASRDARLAGAALLLPDHGGPGPAGPADGEGWGERPLLLVAGPVDEDGGTRRLQLSLLDRFPWAPVQRVTLGGALRPGESVLAQAPDIAERLTAWWLRVLR